MENPTGVRPDGSGLGDFKSMAIYRGGYTYKVSSAKKTYEPRGLNNPINGR